MRGGKIGNTALSLFAGAGGLDEGARMAGIEVVASLEHDPEACEALTLNGFCAVRADVTRVDFRLWAGVDIVFGGPPCQGHSLANHGKVGIERNDLVWEVIRAAEETGARAVLIENVPTFNKLLLDQVLRELSGMGYAVTTKIINAADYGVPQTRRRRFIWAVRSVFSAPWPEPTHHNTPKSIDSEISRFYPHLKPASVPAWSVGLNYKPGVRLMDNQKSWKGAELGRRGDEPAQTITEACNYWRVNIGGEVYMLGYRAAASLQTFRDDHHFSGGMESRGLQVANAVPPLLAYQILGVPF